MARILVSDDFDALRETCHISFTRRGHQVFTARDGIEAYNLFLDVKPDVLITDWHMPAMNGLDLILVLRRLGYRTPAILLSGGSTYVHGHLDDVVILKKPASDALLLKLVDALTESDKAEHSGQC